MRFFNNVRISRHGLWSIAMIAAVAALVVTSQGCCSISKCENKYGMVEVQNCPENCGPLVIVGSFSFYDKSLSDGDCLDVDPTRVKAGAGDGIEFTNNSSVRLTLGSSRPGFFAFDGTFDIEPGHSIVVKIGENEGLKKKTIVGINMAVHPPLKACVGLPGPSIDFD